MSNVVAEASPNLIPIGYKQTEVGVIPEDWDIYCFSDCGYFQSGSGFPTKYQGEQEGDYPFFKVSDMNNIGNENILRSSNNYISENIRNLIAAKIIPINAIIFAKIGAAIFLERKKICFQPSCIDNNLMAYIVNNDKLYYKYAYLLFKNIKLGHLVETTALPSLSSRDIGQKKMAFPAMEEQTAIANALSDVDALITELEKLIAKKQTIKTATMQQLLTGRTRLPQFALREDGSQKGTKQSELGEIPEDWELVSLQNMAIPNGLVRGPFGGAIKKEHFTKNGYKVYEQRNAIYETINIGNYYINQKKFDELKRFSVSHNDFIVSCSGTIGRIYQIPKKHPKGVINQALLKITLNHNIDSKYFYHYFKWDGFQERIIDGTQGGAMKNLVGMAEFKQSLMPLQTIKDEQTSIATILSDMDEDIQALEQRLNKTRNIKQGMMQELLTGRTRLV